MTSLTFVAVLLVTFAAVNAKKCYSCSPSRSNLLQTLDLDSTLLNAISGGDQAPKCKDFDPDDKRFVKDCGVLYTGCLKMAKGGDVLRGCSPLPADRCEMSGDDAACFCKEDLCNSGRPLFPTLLLLLSLTYAVMLLF